MTSACRPPGDHGDHDLRHGADEALHLENMQTPGPCRIHLLAPGLKVRVGVGALDLVTVAVIAAHPLVAARTEGIASVLRAGTIAREDHRRNITRHSRMIEASVQLIDSSRPESITNIGPVEGDAHNGQILPKGAPVNLTAARNPPVIGEVVKVEANDFTPTIRVEGVGNEGECTHGFRVGDPPELFLPSPATLRP